MRKRFLKLVEEHDPEQKLYTVTLTDPKNKVIDQFKMGGVLYAVDNFIDFKKEFMTPTSKVNDAQADPAQAETVEDQEVVSGAGEYNVDDEVAKLAAKAKSGAAGLVGKVFKTGAQKAKKAVKRREKVAELAIDLFNQTTDELEQNVIKK